METKRNKFLDYFSKIGANLDIRLKDGTVPLFNAAYKEGDKQKSREVLRNLQSFSDAYGVLERV